MFRSVRISPQGSFLITMDFEDKVTVWDITARRKLYEKNMNFSTTGSDRTAISHNEKYIVSGHWETKSIRLYDILTGEIIWEYKKTRHIHRLYFSSDNKYIYVNGDTKFEILDVATGTLVDSKKGDLRKYDSPNFDYFILAYKKKYNIYFKGNLKYKLDNESFSFFDICLTNEFFITSEACKALKCIDLEYGTEIWRNTPEYGSHYIDFVFNKDLNIVFAILFYYESAQVYFCAIDNSNGEMLYSFKLDRDRYYSEHFSENGNVFYCVNQEDKILKYNLAKNQSDITIESVEYYE